MRSWNSRPLEVEPSIWWKFTPTERREYWQDKQAKDKVEAERANSDIKVETGVGSSSSSSRLPPALLTPPLPPPDSPPEVHADSGMASRSGALTRNDVTDKVYDKTKGDETEGAWWDSTNTGKFDDYPGSRELGEYLGSSDEARRPSGLHSATSARSPSRQIGEKRSGAACPSPTTVSGTRAAEEHSSEVVV